MAQHDFNIANQVPANLRADLNNAFSAIATNSSGASAPSTTYANQWWYDTTNNLLKIRNEADTAWITVGELDQTSGVWKPYVNGKQIADFLDEDDMASDSATAVPSQQSVKAYVDGVIDNKIVVREQQSSGVGGNTVGAAWTKYSLNTVQHNTITGASLASNQITLPAGTYKVNSWGTIGNGAYNSGTTSYKLRFYNVTDATEELEGGSAQGPTYGGAALGHTTNLPCSGVFTIAGTKVFEFQGRVNGGSGGKMYTATGFGSPEVYAELVIEKIG